MRITYQERLDERTVLCRVRWDDPGSGATLTVATRIAATLEEVPEPRPVEGAEWISEDLPIPVDIQLAAVNEAKRIATAFCSLDAGEADPGKRSQGG